VPEAHEWSTLLGGFAQGVPEYEPDVFNEMMGIYLDVSSPLDLQAESSVEGQGCQHVVEKGHSGRYFRGSGVVELESQANIGFPGLSLYFGSSLSH
jgi:hypothetical protein